MSEDPLVETASQRLDFIYSKADALVKRWFPDLTDPKERRIAVLATMKDLVALVQIEAAVAPGGGAYPPEAKSALGIPKIDLGELDAAPWLTFQTKEPAKPGRAAWMKNPVHFTSFDAPPVILELVNALKKSPDGKLVLGDMIYSFSGKGDVKDHFISRKPVKVK